MSRTTEDASEFKVRLDAARDLLDLSSARLLAVLRSGSSERIDRASIAFRIAKTGFLLAVSEWRDLHDRESFPDLQAELAG